MKKYIYPMALAATLLTTTGCSDDEVNDAPVIPDDQKEMISFSLSDGQNSTRVGFRDSDTRIIMRIQSDDRHATPGASLYTRALATANKDEMDISTDEKKTHAYSDVSMNDDPRYWDDAHGRYSLLSIYAIAIANKNSSNLLPLNLMYDGAGSKSNTTNTAWGSGSDNTISYSVETSAQTNETIGNQDLVYSNNIQENSTLGKDGVYRWDFSQGKHLPDKTGNATHSNGRMLFYQDGLVLSPLAQPTDAPGKFDKGHLKFNHALSRLTVVLVEGNGFDKTSNDKADDFKFTLAEGASAVTNIKLLGMNTTGTLDVKTGVWTPGAATSIDKMAPQATYTNADGEYMAQMLPNYVFTDGSDTNVLTFTIDENTYYVTQDMVFDALKAGDLSDASGSITMEQGKNYRLTIKVDKTKIQALTATLTDWVIVEGEYQIDNSHITVTTKKIDGDGDENCDDFNFYRFGQTLDKIYTDASYTARVFSGDYKTEGRATKEETSSGSGIWNTNWFYESNKIAYHFRTLNDLASGTNDANITNSSATPAVSSFALESGFQDTHDYHWGAPMLQDATLAYSTENGFSASIHDGIVAPKNGEAEPINITELHMMSNINIRLVTDSVAYEVDGQTKYKLGPAAVNLASAEITLTRFAKTGTVDMGTGKITPSYKAPDDPLVHIFDGDNDCAKMETPDFTDTEGKSWNKSGNIHAATDWFTYAVVPQALRRNVSATPAEADCVGITIRTSDNNEYYVIKDLADIMASTVTTKSNLDAERDQIQYDETKSDADNEAAKIKRWFPGHSYNYTIKITKKGIEAITCTVADWVIVEAEEIKIDLES